MEVLWYNLDMAEKKRKKFKIPFRTILSVATVVLVGYVIYENWGDIMDTLEHLNEANLFVLLLLAPEQLFMYYSCGQIFFSYLKSKHHKNFTNKEVMLISTELNFVNHAVPAGGIGGLAYLTYRLHRFKISAGQSSFLYIFRYAVTTVVNYFQALVAVAVLAIMHAIPAEANWIIWVALVMNMGVFAGLALIVYVASNRRRIGKFSRLVMRVANGVVRGVTFGKVVHAVDDARVQGYFDDIHECVTIVRKDKKALIKPTVWGVVYSMCEIATYWIVAISLGRPELLPFIMVGEAIGSIFDAVVPYGLPELGMIGVMSLLLGGDAGVATIVTVMARVFSLLFAVVTGWWPYQKAIRRKSNEHC